MSKNKKKHKKFTQMFVLKHFAIEENASPIPAEKQSKNPFLFNFDTSANNKVLSDDPPLLYSKPTDYDFKKMIKIYLEHKNLI